jgi:hypothetical protein
MRMGLPLAIRTRFFGKRTNQAGLLRATFMGSLFLLTFWGCFFGHLGFFIILFLILLFNIGFLLIFIL